jgi:hypothetical protein
LTRISVRLSDPCSIAPYKLIAAAQAEGVEVLDGDADVRAPTTPLLEFRLAPDSDPRGARREFRQIDPVLAEEVEEATVRVVLRVASRTDDQAELAGFPAELDVVVVVLARPAVRLLPAVKQLVEERPEDLPQVPRVEMPVVEGDRALQAERIVAAPELAEAGNTKAIDAEGDLGDLELEGIIEDPGPSLQFLDERPVPPVFGPLVIGQGFIDATVVGVFQFKR